MSLRDRLEIERTPLPQDLAAWLRKEAPGVVEVLDWLRRNPTEYETLLVLARLDSADHRRGA